MSAQSRSKPWDGFRRPRTWIVLALATLTSFLTSFAGTVAEWRTVGFPWPLRYPFVWGLTGHIALFVVIGALLWVFDRFPLRRENLATTVPLYAVAMTGLCGVETALIWGQRVVLYAALGWEPYHYGDLRWVLPMELMHALPAYLAALGVFSLVRSLEREREKELAAAHLEQQLAEARLGLLKSQLQPHFLFNALNTIRTLVHEDAAAADGVVEQLASFLRLALRHALEQEVPLRTELELLEAYLAVMRARFEDRLEVEVSVDESLRDGRVPHLVLQPLVENAIGHALREHARTARIALSATREGDRLLLRVTDNGPGSRGASNDGHGVGLTNTRARLAALYGDAQSLEASDREEGGFEVRIALPFRPEVTA